MRPPIKVHNNTITIGMQAMFCGVGLAIVPFLYGGVVKEYGWLNDQEFLDAVAVAMITPGPVEQVYATDSESLRQQFIDPVEAGYRAILAALRKKDRDFAALSKQFQEAHSKDYFASELGRQTREKLLKAGGGHTS